MKTKNLSLKEAKESGKPYRCVHGSPWITPDKKDHYILIEHALSDNWEIKYKETYTLEDVEKAIRAVIHESNRTNSAVVLFDVGIEAANK